METDTFTLTIPPCRGRKAVESGAGRPARLRTALAKMPPEITAEVLEAFDEVSRPMTARELEKALMVTDLNFKQRRTVVSALKGFSILLVVPE